MERGSGMRDAPKKAAQSVSHEAIAAEISRLSGFPLNELRAAWCAEFHRDAPKGLSRDLLTRLTLRPWSAA
jgi:hypothetical protein